MLKQPEWEGAGRSRTRPRTPLAVRALLALLLSAASACLDSTCAAQFPGELPELPLHRPPELPERIPGLPERVPRLPGKTRPPQSPARSPALLESIPAPVAQVLTAMAAQAAVIFVGDVQSIDRQPERGFVDISFHVETVLRGTSAGVYVMREWSGLWTLGQDRYHPGERLLLLLRARSSSGFSSPVDGVLNGAIPLLGAALPPLLTSAGQVPADTGSQAASALAGARADLRWVAAQALRTPAGSPAQAASSSPRLRSPVLPQQPGEPPDPSESQRWPGPIPPLPTTGAAGPYNRSLPGVPLAAVLALLNSVPETAADAR